MSGIAGMLFGMKVFVSVCLADPLITIVTVVLRRATNSVVGVKEWLTSYLSRRSQVRQDVAKC